MMILFFLFVLSSLTVTQLNAQPQVTYTRIIANLTKPVNITMAQAINIAVGEVPGTVLESTLVFEKNGGETEDPFYVIKIAVNQDGRKTSKRIIVSGIDGSIGGPHNN